MDTNTTADVVDRARPDETASLRDVACERIRRWILEGRLPAGTRIE
jgi:DNA-binding GntR family transcriptional regulator